MTAPFPGDDTFEKRPCLAGRSTYAKESARYHLLECWMCQHQDSFRLLIVGTASDVGMRRCGFDGFGGGTYPAEPGFEDGVDRRVTDGVDGKCPLPADHVHSGAPER